MKRYASPIITSLLDTDAYKLHMQQAVYHRYRDLSVTAVFRCRGDDVPGHYAGELRQQIDMMQSLALTDTEYLYLSGLPFFTADYLQWLKTFRFKPEQVDVRDQQGKLSITLRGPWAEVILWEIPLLALISELVHRDKTPCIGVDQALSTLHEKLSAFRQASADMDISRFRLMDFGTRRRYSRQVQHAIVETLQQEVPWLSGTSNYDLARRLNISPVGTQAHEWFQAHQQISPELASSQRVALQAWLDEYPDQLGIALTDCITTDAFLRDFDLNFASRYQGLRHDSGEPVEWGEKVIAHYRKLGIDPQTKTLVFSDNLTLDKALALYRHFDPQVRVVFGIGTRLTCDIRGVTPLNIVIKLVSCNGKPVAKLSDSPGKTICHDPSFVRALQKAFELPPVRQAS
ncbi:nicotinate phosphoribosyltransferase [Tatumella terrea]|uniref:nicotinate phosphoribosyltransferase n=1 Tax=Tatumella terrea TaxID=419007 RepID=UPI0031DC0468